MSYRNRVHVHYTLYSPCAEHNFQVWNVDTCACSRITKKDVISLVHISPVRSTYFENIDRSGPDRYGPIRTDLDRLYLYLWPRRRDDVVAECGVHTKNSRQFDSWVTLRFLFQSSSHNGVKTQQNTFRPALPLVVPCAACRPSATPFTWLRRHSEGCWNSKQSNKRADSASVFV